MRSSKKHLLVNKIFKTQQTFLDLLLKYKNQTRFEILFKNQKQLDHIQLKTKLLCSSLSGQDLIIC